MVCVLLLIEEEQVYRICIKLLNKKTKENKQIYSIIKQNWSETRNYPEQNPYSNLKLKMIRVQYRKLTWSKVVKDSKRNSGIILQIYQKNSWPIKNIVFEQMTLKEETRNYDKDKR